jgi:hypothetical protein
MYEDRIIIGIIIGILANTVKLTVNYLSFLFSFTEVVFWNIVATQFLEKKDLFSPAAYVIGGVADIVVTSALGVAFVYFVRYTGSRHLWIKGPGFGLLVWVLIFGTFVGQRLEDKLPQDASGILVTLVAHLFFGLSLALFTNLFIKKSAL